MKIKIFSNIIKKHSLLICSALLMMSFMVGCSSYPIDDDGLLITQRADCYVSNFELLGADHVTVRTTNAAIDTTACTINVEVRFGTDLKNLYPQFTLSQDSKLDPKVAGLTDFSDLSNPRKYTVVSGNRKVRKTYSIFVSVQQP